MHVVNGTHNATMLVVTLSHLLVLVIPTAGWLGLNRAQLKLFRMIYAYFGVMENWIMNTSPKDKVLYQNLHIHKYLRRLVRLLWILLMFLQLLLLMTSNLTINNQHLKMLSKVSMISITL
jgi:hypothetical protein